MRIDHVVTTLGAGGAESLVTNLAIKQANSGHEVGVWTMFTGPAGSQELQNRRVAVLKGVGVEVTQIGSGPRTIARAARGIRKSFPRRLGGDQVIHCHSAATATAAALGASGVPLVLTVHNTEFNFPAPLWRIIAPRIAAVAAVSEGSSKAFSPYIDKPVRVIENGINLAGHVDDMRQFDKTRIVILAVGNLRPQKNYGRLLTSFREILPRLANLGIEAELSIAGEGEERAILEERITTFGLEGKARLLGVRQDIDQLMSLADVFVMSSDHEGQPIALLEALSAGLPCVVTPFLSASDVLKEGEVGAIADDFTAEALASVLVKTIQDPELRRRFSETGTTRAKDYSIDKCADEYQSLYESVV